MFSVSVSDKCISFDLYGPPYAFDEIFIASTVLKIKG